jgi:GT2 family glycosyltransferase
MDVPVLAITSGDCALRGASVPDTLDRIIVGSPGWRARLGGARAVVLILGDRREAAATLAAEQGLDAEHAEALWEHLVRAALTELDGRSVAIVTPAAAGEVVAAWPPAFEDGPGDGAGAATVDEWLAAVAGTNHASLRVPAALRSDAGIVALLAEREILLAEIARLTDVVLAAAAVGPAPRSSDLRAVPGPPPISYKADVTASPDQYRLWLEGNAARRDREVRDKLARLSTHPTFSVVVPIYRPDLDLLDRCIDSVRSQRYPHWELCLFDDCSGDPAVVDALERAAASDRRIHVGFGAQNGGISVATNAAAALATGTFLTLLDQDDELTPDALALVAAAIDDHPTADVVYTDEDKLDEAGNRTEPYFKPDWSPELLLSNMYLGHLLTFRRSLFEEVGGFRSTHDGSQDYDLALRATEKARKVVHVPRVAYHWRKTAGSTALDYRNKPQSDLAARAALADALARRDVDGWVESGMHEGTFRIRRRLPDRPTVSIIVPYHDGAPLLSLCLRSIEETIGDDVAWDVLLVDNRSWEPETFALASQLRGNERYRFLEYDHSFNWSAMNNLAAAETSADYLLFMNSDIEARQSGWLEAMLEPALDPDVGAVGARLLYPDGRIQHAGVVLGLGAGVAWHPFCFLPGDQPGYFAQPRVMRNWSAVTGACMLVPRALFEETGGFDERLPTAFNDVDFCLRLGAAGRRIVYTPFAELVHHESASRGTSAMEVEESIEMLHRYEALIKHDPYFNANLDIHRQEYNVSIASEEVDPWIWIEWVAASS